MGKLTEAQAAWLSTARSSGSLPFNRRVGSATKSRCERAGLVVRDQMGTYYITEAGRTALSAAKPTQGGESNG